MDDISVIDTFLKHLYDKGNKGACLVDVVSVDKSQRDRIETTLTGKSLVEELKSYVAGKRKFKLSDIAIDIINEHGSYSSFINAKKREQTNARILKAITVIGTVSGIVGIGWGIWQDTKNDRLEIENSELQVTVDSLTKEIEVLKVPQIVVPSDSSTVTEKVKEKK